MGPCTHQDGPFRHLVEQDWDKRVTILLGCLPESCDRPCVVHHTIVQMTKASDVFIVGDAADVAQPVHMRTDDLL